MSASSSASLLLPLPSLTTSSDPTSTTASSAPTTATTPTTANSPTPTTSHPTTGATATSPTTTSASSTSTTHSTTSATQIVTASSGQAVTVTSYITPSATTTSTPQTHSTSNSFFSNQGAVAGVFSAVGLIVVALVIALIVNAIRRRRAQKFDRDVAEAAAEAAMSSRSPFDDYSYANNGGNGGGGYGYSENSHGTYQQSPLPPQSNSYGMSEMSQYDPYAAAPPTLAAAAIGRASSRNESASGTAGIAGVGAGNLAREPSKHAPYHAFAGPGPQPHELRGGTMRSRRGDVLEAAGLADTGAAAMAANNSYNNEAFLARKPSEYTQNTHHSVRSQGDGSMSNHPAILQPGYPVDSYYPQRNDTHSPPSFVGIQPAQTTLPNPHDATLPSPSLPGHQSDHTFGDNEEHHDSGSPTALRSDEQRMSYQDDADYTQGSRVLRVANE